METTEMFPVFIYVSHGIVSCFILALLAFIVYSKWVQGYWKKKKVPYLEPNLLLGNLQYDFLFTHPTFQLKKMYNKLKAKGVSHGGGIYLLTSAKYLLVDPQAIKSIIQCDYQHFTHRNFYYNEKADPFSANLAFISGQRWQDLRTALTSAFSPGRVITAFDTFVDFGRKMTMALDMKAGDKSVDIKQILNRYATDSIASYAFGLETNSFDEGSEFVEQGERVFESNLRLLKILFAQVQPTVCKFFGVGVFDDETRRYFTSVFQDAVKSREGTTMPRKDALRALIDLKDDWIRANREEGEAMVELAAHAYGMYGVGYEYCSCTMTYALYELALNPSVQTRLRKEIVQALVKHGGELTYEALMEMEYLDQVFHETLRKYPPIAVTDRLCVKDYRIPGSNVTLEEGTHTYISIIALHHDPDFFPCPDSFNPDRFSAENRRNIVPFSYLPFGGGHRMCLGFKLALTIVKVALALLVQNYSISLDSRTDVPMRFRTYCPVLVPKSPVMLNFNKVSS